MRRKVALLTATAGAALVMLFAAFLWTREGPEPPAAADGVRDAPVAVETTDDPGPVVVAPPPAPVHDDRQKEAAPNTEEVPGATPPPLSVPTQGRPSRVAYRKLADALGLEPAESTPATRLMREYSAEELALMASVQRATGGDVPGGVSRIIELRRQGADYETLRGEAAAALAGDLMARLAVDSWLRQQFDIRPREPAAPPEPDERIRLGGRLRRAAEEKGEKPAAKAKCHGCPYFETVAKKEGFSEVGGPGRR